MIRVGVLGAEGKMGQAIMRLLKEEPQKFSAIGITKNEKLQAVIDSLDVLIDFSTSRATLENVEIVVSRGKPIVVGTTGFNESEKNDFLERAQKVPCVFSPNMSIGVNLLFKLTSEVSKILKDYDIEIFEAHHSQKKDAPSGTALKLKEKVEEAIHHKVPVHSVRAGDIVGDHTVLFATNGERLELTHKASSRDTFAKGAITAAVWVLNQKPGVYNMQDVLGLK
ncbi:MAG: 4-hydroxy-tetrahydrodipicolinate reductase [Deltaproteobacteria bacterium]|nr:4-hydroxy-tetrahydrodipicolinate reductase [Deltaproteobacteria bacterium]